MDRRNFIAGTAGLLPVAVSAQVQTLRDRVLGAWRILDAETVNLATGATNHGGYDRVHMETLPTISPMV